MSTSHQTLTLASGLSFVVGSLVTVKFSFFHSMAAKSAGFSVLRIVNEPAAATLAYGWFNLSYIAELV